MNARRAKELTDAVNNPTVDTIIYDILKSIDQCILRGEYECCYNTIKIKAKDEQEILNQLKTLEYTAFYEQKDYAILKTLVIKWD